MRRLLLLQKGFYIKIFDTAFLLHDQKLHNSRLGFLLLLGEYSGSADSTSSSSVVVVVRYFQDFEFHPQ